MVSPPYSPAYNRFPPRIPPHLSGPFYPMYRTMLYLPGRNTPPLRSRMHVRVSPYPLPSPYGRSDLSASL
eukprot:6204613-Pleurochrysis_carterae.AAC.2